MSKNRTQGFKALLDIGLVALSRFACKHSTGVLLGAIALLFLSLLTAWTFLEFETDRDKLIGPDDALYIRHQKFLAEFPRADDVVVIAQGASKEHRENFVNVLAGLLNQEPTHFYAVFPRVDLPFLTSQALMFMGEDLSLIHI